MTLPYESLIIVSIYVENLLSKPKVESLMTDAE